MFIVIIDLSSDVFALSTYHEAIAIFNEYVTRTAITLKETF